MNTTLRYLCFQSLCLIAWPTGSEATTPIFYANSGTFSATLTSSVTDDYTSSGYSFFNTNAAMSPVLGETDYISTGFTEFNLAQADASYCAGAPRGRT
jgi:hypothetical protein